MKLRLFALFAVITLCRTAALAAAPASTVPAAAPAPHAAAATSTVDDRARFLAGLPPAPGSPLATLAAGAGFKEHAADLDAKWAAVRTERLDRMTAWAAAEVAPRVHAEAPMYYIFGGPDFLTAATMYPDAPVYVLAGLEPIGKVPALESMSAKDLDAGLRNLRTSMRTLLKLSFFVTSEMGSDLTRTHINGVLPLFYVYMGRLGMKVVDTEYVYLDPAGEVKTVPAGTTPDNGVPGVRVRFQREGKAKPQELYYFRQDIIDAKLPAKPGLFPFMAKLGNGNTFLKAASFILFDHNFAKTKDFLLEHSLTILQDDSGLPYAAFKKDAWDFSFYGEYTRSRVKEFKAHYQTELKKAVDAAKPPALPFRTGYAHEGASFLMFAAPRKAQAAL